MAGRTLGNGSDNDPLVVGISTIKTLRHLQHLGTVGVLCLDATYSLNGKDFPVIIYGVADAAHSFHPVAFFVVSDESAETYKKTMAALASAAFLATGIELAPEVVLSDGALSIHAAVAEKRPHAEHLMCYAHMCRAAKKHLQKPQFRTIIDEEFFQRLRDDLNRLHQSTSSEKFAAIKLQIIPDWPVEVAGYMTNQWLEGPCSRWQKFCGRPGGIHSNQGQECFNRLAKVFSLRKRAKMSECFSNLIRLMEYAATRQKEFRITSGSTEFVGRSRRGRRSRRSRRRRNSASDSGRPTLAPRQRSSRRSRPSRGRRPRN